MLLRERQRVTMTHETRLASLGIALPVPLKPIATYATIVQHGQLLYTSGHAPLRPDGTWGTGKLGATLDVAAGREAARLTGLALLATLWSRCSVTSR